MIAPRNLPIKYSNWNKTWGAPYGYYRNSIFERVRLWFMNVIFKKTSNTIIKKILIKFSGMFAFQPNSTNRTFEYPWAFYATPLKKSMNVIDIGGGISGFQFVLSKTGINVTNIDPSDKEYNWIYNDELFRLFNAAFGTNVHLIEKYLDKASLNSNSYDRIYCISVLEHLTEKEQKIIIKEAYRLLKKGGFFIITLDLFLDIYPFSDIIKNKWGSNMNSAEFIKNSKFTLIQGKKNELLGFSEFKMNNVMKNLSNYFLGSTYPVLTQAFVLQKK